MKPPSGPKEDSSWLQLKEYEVCVNACVIRLNEDVFILDNITKS